MVDFIYVVMILISLGDGNSQYTRRYGGVCPKPLTNAAPHKEYVGWLESLGLVQHYTKGVAYRCLEVTAQLFPLPLWILPLQWLNSGRWIFAWRDLF